LPPFFGGVVDQAVGELARLKIRKQVQDLGCILITSSASTTIFSKVSGSMARTLSKPVSSYNIEVLFS
jgi:hypothetical protein